MKKDSLATFGQLNTKELGPKLIEAAQEQQRADTQKVVVEGVKAILVDINQQQQAIASCEDRIAKQRRRIKALERGEFKVNFSPVHSAPQVAFDDPELRGL